MEVAALKWIGDVDGFLELIDQRRLPAELVKLHCRGIEQVYEAIKTLAVRGAPAIGVTAAYGLVLGIQKLSEDEDLQQGLGCLAKSCEYFGRTRPTAANLFWALERVKRTAEQFVAARPGANLQELKEKVLAEANAIFAEDVDMCRRIGENGQRFIKQGAGVLRW